MSEFTSRNPAAIDKFREATVRHMASMVGVMKVQPRKKCVCCEKQRTEITGKHTARGFVCGMCLRAANQRGAK